MYYNGHGTKQNFKKGFEWNMKAAEAGHIGAEYNVGVYYNNGERVKQDYKKAFEWFNKAAQKRAY